MHVNASFIIVMISSATSGVGSSRRLSSRSFSSMLWTFICGSDDDDDDDDESDEYEREETSSAG